MTRLSPLALAAIVFGALAGAAGVALGAWAAHGLAEGVARLAETASRYALFHAAAMIAAALVLDRVGHGWPRRLTVLALVLFALGIMLFCGGLIGAAVGIATGTAPLGGMALIAAWVALAGAAGAAFKTAP
jgi:uncharacterized membrane protein YgdD (TMEM256/DUF423 family)